MVKLLCRNRLCSEIPEPGRLRLLRKFSITHLYANRNVTYYFCRLQVMKVERGIQAHTNSLFSPPHFHQLQAQVGKVWPGLFVPVPDNITERIE